MSGFAITFLAMVVFALGLVFLLGQYLIRRSMGPIELLQKATGRIASGEFGHTVTIQSGDEFEDLGKAFNEMSIKLEESQRLLLRTARLGTMDQMASGFVHEVKQPMSAIYGLVQLIALKVEDKEILKLLQTVKKAVESLNTTLDRFSSFSKDKPMKIGPLDINDIVREIYLLQSIRFSKRGITVEQELAPGLSLIDGDARSLQQVVSNLLVNALDAVEAGKKEKPTVTVRTWQDHNSVSLEIRDNGCGMTQEVQEKIFDPFYTTKSTEKGTGIGMAIVESIVTQHQAKIELESEEGAGTAFRITFPVPKGGVKA